jgi:hypothetical protein
MGSFLGKITNLLPAAYGHGKVSVKSSLVNWLPWSVLKISGGLR